MRETAIQLPWEGRAAPHALLDVGRRCDISCAGCYNGQHTARFKTVTELEAELERVLEHRRLHTVTLSGGEPTLHPGLPQIVAAVRRQGLKVALLTHGASLTPTSLAALRDAGLNVILLHIQPTQRRPDIAPDASPDDWRRLRAAKAAFVSEHGIEAGLSWIARKSRLHEYADVVDEVLASPHLHFLLVTGFRDFSLFVDLRGTVTGGLQTPPGFPWPGPGPKPDEVSLDDLEPHLRRRGLTPFGFVGSSHDPQRRRWLTFLTGTLLSRDGACESFGLSPAWSDRWLMRASRWWSGRALFFFKPTSWQFRLQIIFNALSGGDVGADIRLLSGALRGQALLDKHIVLQEGPNVRADGEVEICRDCPDAVWQEGGLVPVCLADRMAAKLKS